MIFIWEGCIFTSFWLKNKKKIISTQNWCYYLQFQHIVCMTCSYIYTWIHHALSIIYSSQKSTFLCTPVLFCPQNRFHLSSHRHHNSHFFKSYLSYNYHLACPQFPLTWFTKHLLLFAYLSDPSPIHLNSHLKPSLFATLSNNPL